MNRTLIQNYGPLFSAFPSLNDLLWISEQAFIKTRDLVGQSPQDWQNPPAKLLQLLMYQGLNTSYSIRLLTTFAQPLEAYALLRMRLEQVIVMSYLVNVEKEKGFDLFFADVGRIDYRSARSLDKDPELKKIVEIFLGDRFQQAQKAAEKVEKEIDPSFDISSGKLKRKWTDLSTYDLAKRRDALIKNNDPIQSTKLVWFYISLYKPSSILLHGDTGSVTNNFLSAAPNKDIGPQLAYVFLNIIQNAQLDLLQCYEAVRYFKKPGIEKLTELHKEFKELLLKQV